MAATPLVLCNCNGKDFWTTAADCSPSPPRALKGTTSSTVVATAAATVSPPELVPYELPSGKLVVGSHHQYLQDNGELVYRFISPVQDLSTIKDDDQVICKLKSGLGVVETHANCKKINGTVTGMLAHKLDDPNKP
jgi:hypothetical protein